MPRLPEPTALSFEYLVEYSDLPILPVIFSREGSYQVFVLCLIDSGASGILLPSELAAQLGISLEDPSVTVIGVTGSTQGWSHPLTATLPEVDGFSFVAEAVFVPGLPDALLGRSPAFNLLDIAFQHRHSRVYFQMVDTET